MLSFVPTHIRGLDTVLGGGIPKGNVVLICGTPGSRKTSLAFSMLYHNAKKGKKGLFICLEQTYEELVRAMELLGMPSMNLNELYVLDVARVRAEMNERELTKNWMEILKVMIEEGVEKSGYEILAIDSLEVLYALGSLKNPRRELFHFFTYLRELGATTFLVSEIPFGNTRLCQYGEDFLADGVIYLKHFEVGETEVQLRMRCVKMRKTNHQEGYFAFGFDGERFFVTNVTSMQSRSEIPELRAPM